MLASQHIYRNKNSRRTKNNIRTTALERSVEYTTRGGGGGGGRVFKALLQITNFTLGPDATLNIEIHKKAVRIKALNSVNASKRKHKSQINHNDKQRRVLMANSSVFQSKLIQSIVEPRPKTYCQAPSHWLKKCFTKRPSLSLRLEPPSCNKYLIYFGNIQQM